MHKEGFAVLGVAASKDLLHWQDRGCVLKRPIQNDEGQGTNMIESPCVFHIGEKIFLVYNQGRGIRYIVSNYPFNFEGMSIKIFQDGIYNFEILNAETGLLANASGGYYSCVRFGYVKFLENTIKFVNLILITSQKPEVYLDMAPGYTIDSTRDMYFHHREVIGINNYFVSESDHYDYSWQIDPDWATKSGFLPIQEDYAKVRAEIFGLDLN